MKKTDDKKGDNTAKDAIEEVAWKDKYVRALADYQNLEKRSLEQIQEARLFAAEIVIGKLLPVVDTLDKASEHIKDAGFDLAYKQLLAVLKEQGVLKMVVVGKPFNPHEMECVEVVDLPAMPAHAGQAGGENDIIVEETRSGYTYRGKVLRVAQVKVGKQMDQEPKV